MFLAECSLKSVDKKLRKALHNNSGLRSPGRLISVSCRVVSVDFRMELAACHSHGTKNFDVTP